MINNLDAFLFAIFVTGIINISLWELISRWFAKRDNEKEIFINPDIAYPTSKKIKINRIMKEK